jgi:nuclear transcription factor Y, alpha
MRRPRGPGGRFLTADEIAAQKAANGEDTVNKEETTHSPDNDADDDEEEAESPVAMAPVVHSPPDTTYVHGHAHPPDATMGMLNIGYHPSESPSSMVSSPRMPQQPYPHPHSHSQLLPAIVPSQAHPLYVQPQQTQLRALSSESSSPSLALPSAYAPAPIRMHHLNYPQNQGMYSSTARSPFGADPGPS